MMNYFSETLKKFFISVASCSHDGVVQALRPAPLIAAPDAKGRQSLPVVNHALVLLMPTLFFGTAKAGAEERNKIASRCAPWAVYNP
jgi:hypothetical protein